jgi:translation initiation factor IF-2
MVGGRVVEGNFRVKAAFDVERGGEIVGRGRATNLQQQKKDTANVAAGNEAGLLVESNVPITKGDVLVIPHP